MWSFNKDLTLLYESKDPPTFSSSRWRRGYNPDLVFISNNRWQVFQRNVLDHISRSQHRPVEVNTRPIVKPIAFDYLHRFNFKKAYWASFTEEMEIRTNTLAPTPENYAWIWHIWTAAQNNIPRGCRINYIPRLSPETRESYDEYARLCNEDPFNGMTIQLGEALMNEISGEKEVVE